MRQPAVSKMPAHNCQCSASNKILYTSIQTMTKTYKRIHQELTYTVR